MENHKKCVVCGKPISKEKRNYKTAIYCGLKCGARARDATRRGHVLPPPPPHAHPEPAPPPRAHPKWPIFGVVAGELTHAQFKAATVSDRDPRSGRSKFEDTEARNKRLLDEAGFGLDPTTLGPGSSED